VVVETHIATTLLVTRLRQRLLPQRPPIAAALPAARCHDVQPAVVVETHIATTLLVTRLRQHLLP